MKNFSNFFSKNKQFYKKKEKTKTRKKHENKKSDHLNISI